MLAAGGSTEDVFAGVDDVDAGSHFGQAGDAGFHGEDGAASVDRNNCYEGVEGRINYESACLLYTSPG